MADIWHVFSDQSNSGESAFSAPETNKETGRYFEILNSRHQSALKKERRMENSRAECEAVVVNDENSTEDMIFQLDL